MVYIGIREAGGIVSVYYKATWDYDYAFMLSFFQVWISEDIGEKLIYAAAGDYDKTTSFLNELIDMHGQPTKCISLQREQSYISIGGFSKSMNCDMRITLWNHTDHVHLEVIKPELFSQQGDHAFDIYMDSIEILSYIEITKSLFASKNCTQDHHS